MNEAYFFAAALASEIACRKPDASKTPGTRKVPIMNAGVPRWRQNATLGDLLLNDRAFSGTRLQRVGSHIESRACLVKARLGNSATAKKVFTARKAGANSGQLR